MEAHERRALPEGWGWKKLLEVIKYKKGRKPAILLDQETEGSLQYLTAEYFRTGTSENFVPKDEISKCISCSEHDIILIWDGSNAGDIFMGLNGVVASTMVKIEPKESLLESYAHFFLKTQFQNFREHTNGSSIPHVNKSSFDNTKIPLPPLPTQCRIVSLLEKAEETKRLRAQADELTDRLLQGVFMETFGDPVRNPKGWEMIKLGELTEISSGSTPSRDVPAYFGGEIPWVKTTEVKGIRIHDTEEYITTGGLNNSSCKIYPKKSIIIAMYGQGKTRGNVGLLEINATTNQACCVLKPNEKYDSVYLFELLKNSYNNLRNLGRGGNQPNLNGEIIKNYVILLPPLPLQQKFARIVEKIESMRQSQNQSKQKIEDLFSTLMQKAFRGELVA